MKVLFIGGTGLISIACTRLAVERGIDLYLLTRGRHVTDLPEGVHVLQGDIRDAASATRALDGHTFDAVVNWVAFSPKDVANDIALFKGRTKQYVLISSASAYQKPPAHYVITEDTPLVNPYWQYSRDKIACEDLLVRAMREQGFPGVIVRPSLTYGDTMVPLAINSWHKSYTAVARMKRGERVIVPGDGSSLWTVTHNSDFAVGLVGLLGNANTIGHAFHITSDEVLTWDQIYRLTAEAAGGEAKIVHLTTDFIAACCPDEGGGLYGDKAVSAVFDNRKIKSFVPEFGAKMSYARGIRQTMDWFHADSAREEIDAKLDERWDKIIAAHDAGLEHARKIFTV